MDSRNPAAQILPPTPRHHKARRDNHIPEFLLARKAVNALHQVLVARPVPRHQLPYQRNGAKAPPLVNGVDDRVPHLAELEAREYAAGLEHAERLAQRGVLVGEVPDPEGDGVQVDAAVLDADGAQVLGVCEEEV